jgi:mono/diheme cytochrome c family protein
MRKLIYSLGIIVVLSFSIAVFCFAYTPWVAPSVVDTLVNPLKGNETATAEGKKTYTAMCVMCHGEKGKGDGVAGLALTPRPANYTLPKVQAESDGSLFWKMTTGRAPMASYKALLTETQRWQLVNYLRTFKK